MKAPKIDDAPGLRWRKRSSTFVAVWVARDDIIKNKGYPTKTQRLWEGITPTEIEKGYVRSQCVRLQNDMLKWGRGQVVDNKAFDGTVRSLIRCYEHDPDSRYHNLRHKSKGLTDYYLRMIELDVGARLLSVITGSDFLRWHAKWIEPAKPDGLRRVDRAHGAITTLRQLLRFGVFKGYAECARLQIILCGTGAKGTGMAFENGRVRTEELTRDQVVAVCTEAHRIGRHSIALAQAFQFELGLRQKDVIGEWLPMSEPGTSDVLHHGRKWMYGIDWREITEAGGKFESTFRRSAELVLTHRLSKSVKGRSRVLDPRTGKVMRFFLSNYPMIRAEIARVPPEARVGPLVIEEATGRPFQERWFQLCWREIARKVGVPNAVQNRDSRAGAITEGIEVSGGDIEAVRQAHGHSKADTTRRYDRGGDRQTAKIAVLRSKRHEGE